jgi:hypothetical protein
LNLSIAAATGAVIARCDSQAVFPPNYLTTAVRTLRETGAANVGGRQLAVGRTRWERAVAIAQSIPMGVGDARYRTGGQPGPVDTVYLGVFRRDALARVGGYDVTFTRNQDYELNWRLREAGEVIWFDPELAVEYTPRSSVGALARQYYEYGLWKRRMVAMHPRSLRMRQVAAPALVAGLVASAVGIPFAPVASLVLPSTYAGAIIATAAVESLKRRTGSTLLIGAALPIMHIAWGVGFFSGQRARSA